MASEKIYVLGAGRVGSAIARDLADDYDILSLDQSTNALSKVKDYKNINVRQIDLTIDSYHELLDGADLVISAVPGFMGYSTLKKVLEAGKNVVDISFFPEDPFDLDELAKNNQLKAVVDCGVAPGMGNIILGRYDKEMDVQYYECLVGGLPVKRDWPWEYKAVFSPIDVIEEYIRPARIVQGGKLVVREALSDAELVEFGNIGTLESFNTDGLRTLVRTMKIPDMIEKTLRYPGTIEYLKVLRDSGFFSYDPVEINGSLVKPIEMTSRILFPQWELKPGEEDMTIMRIVIGGVCNGKNCVVRYDLLDRYDRKNDILSMARTTGYTCTATARLMMEGKVNQMGIIPPEYIGKSKENFDNVMDYMAKRGVKYKKTESIL